MQKRIEPQKKAPKQQLDQTFFSPPVQLQTLTKDIYSLDFQTIIAVKADDSEWHARVGAYSDEKFQLLSKTKITATEKRIPFGTYFLSLVEHNNVAQRNKYRLMKGMIDIISEVYGTVVEYLRQHEVFCKELLFQIDVAMSTSATSFAERHKVIERTITENETPASMICQYWTSLESKFNLDEEKSRAYTKLFKELITCFVEAFLADEKSRQFKNHFTSRKYNCDPCVSWFYISVLWDANDGDEKKLSVFKTDYQKTCCGLASEFVYLPDMWEFLLRADHQVLKSSKDTINDIDKILKKQKGLLECRPEEQNKLMTSLSKMTL